MYHNGKWGDSKKEPYLPKLMVWLFLVLIVGWINTCNADEIEVEKRIAAHEILLVDEGGHQRAGFKFLDNRPTLFIADKSGVTRSIMAESSNGVIFYLNDENGKMRVSLAHNDGSGTQIALWNGKDKGRLSIRTGKEGLPEIFLLDNKNQVKIFIKATDYGALMSFSEGTKKPGILIQSRDGKGAAISLHDSNKQPKIYLAMLDDRPRFSLEDPQGSGLFAGVAPGGEAYLSLLAQGEPVWVATEASRQAVQQGLSEMDEWGQAMR